MTRPKPQPELPRIDATELPALREQIVRAAKPVILTGLLRGQPLSELTDPARARARLGELTLTWRRNYTDSHLVNIERFLRGHSAPVRIERRRATFAEYLALIAREPDTRWLITEEPTPGLLLRDLQLGALGIARVEAGYGSALAAPSYGKAWSLLFAANRGNSSDLHTDWDGRDVVLYQVFGRKRILLFPPAAAPKLHPIDVYSTLQIHKLSDSEREALALYAGGVEAVLEPNDAIFMPAFWWHHVDYLEPALSVSFRFGGIEDPGALALAGVMHRDYCVQNIIAGTRDPERAQACRSAVQKLLAARQAPYRDVRTKYRTLKRLARELHAQTAPSTAAPFITSEALLEGVLCDVYRHRAEPGAPLSERWSEAKDRVAIAVRRLGRRISHWA